MHASGGDGALMARAIEIAERGRATAPPNPWVGCVIARDGQVVGEGFHVRPGEPPAEVAALRAAGTRARGATAYVTLEPCAHEGRTPPCADALIDAGISRVVAALEDPDPRVRGRGFDRLRAAGVDVVVGMGAPEAEHSLAPYLHHRATGRAYCLAKVAMTLDGRIAAADRTSRWITGEAARHDAHELRAESQAIVVGSGTALVDDPALTVRGIAVAAPPPLRVLLDGRGRVPATGALFDTGFGPTLVLTTDAASDDAVDGWRAAGAKVEVIPAGTDGVGVDLAAALALLGKQGVLQAMFEGGAHVHGSIAAAGLADRVVAYVAPMLLGERGLPAFAWQGPETLADVGRFELATMTRLGDDVRINLRRSGGPR